VAQALDKTPIDSSITNLLPLPVLMQSSDFNLGIADFHHHFHPEKSEQLGFDTENSRLYRDYAKRLGGLAVRHSRGQLIPRWLHDRYHDTFSGPLLPTTDEDQFKTVVLACAGIVPRQAIELYVPGEARIVEMSDRQYNFVRLRTFYEGADQFKHSKRNKIGSFLVNYVINNSLDELAFRAEVEQKVAEFLRPKNEEQRRNAGRDILAYAIESSVAELIPIHQEAKKERLVKPTNRSLTEVILRFVTTNKLLKYYDSIEDQLGFVLI
jgi:hypothetical protein